MTEYWEEIEGKSIKDLDLPVGQFVGYCPICGRELIVKNGKYGKFIGCSGYKATYCNKTYNIKYYRLMNYDALADITVKARNEHIKILKDMLKKEDVWNWNNKTIEKYMEYHPNSEEVKELCERISMKLYEFMEYEATH